MSASGLLLIAILYAPGLFLAVIAGAITGWGAVHMIRRCSSRIRGWLAVRRAMAGFDRKIQEILPSHPSRRPGGLTFS
jgi:hypothetical protein